jgi:hypothetical protein
MMNGRRRRPPHRSAPEQARVVVKFRESLEPPADGEARAWLLTVEDGALVPLLEDFPGLRIAPLFPGVDEEWVTRREKWAQRLVLPYEPQDFRLFFLVRPPDEDEEEQLCALREQFHSWRSVEYAYVDAVGDPPGLLDDLDPGSFFGEQGYLDPAPAGIDAKFAWGLPGGDGAGVRFVDIEQGWSWDAGEGRVEHEDLNWKEIELLKGDNMPSHTLHGNSVLGVICADPTNGEGCAGIAPNADEVSVVSYHGDWDSGPSTGEPMADFFYAEFAGPNVAEAVRFAADHLDSGSVLLLEVQASYKESPFGDWRTDLPIEVHEANRQAIQYAVFEQNVVVVEAAGNAGDSLDEFKDWIVDDVLGEDPDVLARPDDGGTRRRDSGAVLVAAGKKDGLHERVGISNYGSGIDCYAWGDGVVTSGLPPDEYNQTFKNTSSAAAIVAGAAMCLHGIAKARDQALSALEMRRLLSTHGTPSSSNLSEFIGVMPDLKAVIEATFDLEADVYLRSQVGDQGAENEPNRFASPDILLLRDTGATDDEMQEAYGEDSPSENDEDVGHALVPARDYVVHLRVRNRGGGPSGPGAVGAYWAPVATLLRPNLWKYVGWADLADVPATGELVVSSPIHWRSDHIPAPNERGADKDRLALVGVVTTEHDSTPNVASLPTMGAFRHAVLVRNNIAWRNSHIVPYGGGPDADRVDGYMRIPFLITGAHDHSRKMHLDFSLGLPGGSRVFLAAPPAFMARAGEFPIAAGPVAGAVGALRPRAAAAPSPLADHLRTADLGRLGGGPHHVAVRAAPSDPGTPTVRLGRALPPLAPALRVSVAEAPAIPSKGCAAARRSGARSAHARVTGRCAPRGRSRRRG